MAIRIPTTDQSKIFLGSQEIGAVYVGANKVWPDAPTEQFTIVHTKQTGFTITVACSTYGLVTINWGDGTSTVVTSGIANAHNYALSGEHTVVISGDITKITSLYCTTQSVSAITLTSSCSNITDLRCQGNILTTLDVSYLTKLTRLYCSSMTSLSSIIMPTEVTNVATRDYQLNSTSITNYINPIGAINFSYLYLYSCPNLASINLTTLTGTCTEFSAYSSGLQQLTTYFQTCTRYYVYSCANLVSLSCYCSSISYFSFNSNLQMQSLLINSSTSVNSISARSCFALNPPTLILVSVTSIDLYSCNFTEAEVDAVLNNCLSINDNTCTLELRGTNSSPSASGLSAKNALIARGWTVLTR